MELKNGKITILVGQGATTIELKDRDASIIFCKVTLTNDQLASALSRLAETPCKIETGKLDRIGKTHENQPFSFEINEEMRGNKGALNQACLRALSEQGMEEWVPDTHYGSQETFYKEGDKHYARTTIRRWI